MSEAYRRFRIMLIRSMETLVILITGILVIDVVWQVFTRFVLNDPSGWTEELATLLMIWMALFGACIGFIRYSHLGVDFFTAKLPPRWRIADEIAVHALVAFFAAAVLVFGGSRIVYFTLLFGQRSAALGVKMGYVYLALPLSGLFITWFSVEGAILKTVELIRHNAARRPEET